jgi:hypothetical protein
MIHPAPDCFVGDCDPTFRQQILDVAEAQCESKIEPNRLLNDLGWEPVSDIADFRHPLGYRAASGTATPRRRDNALWSYDGTLDRLHDALYVKCREHAGRDASPTAAIIDSQSVKSAEKGGVASTRMAMMRERKSKARSGIFSSIRKAS